MSCMGKGDSLYSSRDPLAKVPLKTCAGRLSYWRIWDDFRDCGAKGATHVVGVAREFQKDVDVAVFGLFSFQLRL